MPSLASRERLSFSKLREVLELPDLIAVQRLSFDWFLEEGVKEVLDDISPIEDFTGQLKLELSDHIFDPPKYSEDECRERDMTYARPLFVTARFMNAQTGEIKEQTVFMGDFPMMTDKGTFVINGTERVIVTQLGAVDDEGAVLRHHREVAHEDGLLADLARVLVHEADRHRERRLVAEIFLAALADRRGGLSELV